MEIPADRRRPHASRLDPSHPRYEEILAAHEDAEARGRDGYLDPASGLFVFTAAFLWARGSCCHSGCRHCPWIGGEGP